MIKKIVVGLLAFIVIGCGFHLRGAIVWPEQYQNVYMVGYDATNHNSFFSSIKRFFPKNVTIVSSESDADVLIRVLSEGQTMRKVSGLGKDTDIEEVITMTIVVEVTDSQGQPIMPATALSRERDFSYSESDLLGKSTDSQNISREIRQELGAMFMRRLEAAMRNQ